MHIIWFAHSDNPAYAGVRLRYLLPAVALRRAGHQVSPGGATPDQRADLAIVQGKWLLDCGTAAAMQPRLALLQRLRDQGCQLVLDCFDNYFLNEGQDAERAALLDAFRAALPLYSAFTVSSPGLAPFFRAEVGPAACLRVVGDPLEGPGAHRLYETPWQIANPSALARNVAGELAANGSFVGSADRRGS